MVQNRDIGITPVFAVNRDAEIGPVWPAAAGLFGRAFRVDEAESSAFYTEGRRLDTVEPLAATTSHLRFYRWPYK